VFIVLKNQNEKETTVFKIRSDHGGEIENKPFEQICETHGILHNFFKPRTL